MPKAVPLGAGAIHVVAQHLVNFLEVWERGVGMTGQGGNNGTPWMYHVPPLTEICRMSPVMTHKIGLIPPILQMRN